MAQLTFIQGGMGERRVWRRDMDGRADSAITVLNGHSRGGGLQDPDGAFSIKWVPRGRTIYRVNGAGHPLADARSLILNPGQPYALEFPDGPASETLCVFFSDDLVHEAWTSLQDPAGGLEGRLAAAPEFPELVFAPDSAIGDALEALRASFATEDPTEDVDEARMLSLLGRLLATAQQHRLRADQIPALKPSTRRALLAKLQRVRDLIDDDPARALSLAVLARESALSKFHLLRLFKATFGATPAAYAQARRIERATALLVSTARPVGRIAEELGYETATSLIRAFRRHTGQTPAIYRGKIRNLG